MSYLCWFLFPLRTAFSFPLCVFKYLPFLLSQPTFHTIHKAFSLNLPIIQMEAFSSAKEPDSTNTEGDSWSCSVAQLCPTLWDPMDCSTPGFPVIQHLPELAQTHVHWVIKSNILSSNIPFSSYFQSFPASGYFPLSWLFTSGGQSIGASPSSSVPQMNILDWFLLEFWLVFYPCSLKDTTQSSPTPQFKSISSSALSCLDSPAVTSIHDYWINHNLEETDLCW